MARYCRFNGYLAEHGIKKKEVAKMLNISQTALQMKFAGKQEFTVPQIRLLCEKYKLSADIFLS